MSDLPLTLIKIAVVVTGVDEGSVVDVVSDGAVDAVGEAAVSAAAVSGAMAATDGRTGASGSDLAPEGGPAVVVIVADALPFASSSSSAKTSERAAPAAATIRAPIRSTRSALPMLVLGSRTSSCNHLNVRRMDDHSAREEPPAT